MVQEPRRLFSPPSAPGSPTDLRGKFGGQSIGRGRTSCGQSRRRLCWASQGHDLQLSRISRAKKLVRLHQRRWADRRGGNSVEYPHPVNQSINPPLTQSSNTMSQSINQSISHSLTQSSNTMSQSINQSINSPLTQSINQWNEPVNQSINQSMEWYANKAVNQSINWQKHCRFLAGWFASGFFFVKKFERFFFVYPSRTLHRMRPPTIAASCRWRKKTRICSTV